MPDFVDPTSAIFLAAEHRTMPTHVGILQLFDKPAGAGPDYVRHVYEDMIRVDDVAALFLRRPHRSVATGGQYVWREDSRFDVDHHVRHSGLPGPGRYRELFELCSRLHSVPLARDRPLWEAHVIEGLADDKFAVYIKMHHALIDGLRGIRLMQASLSTDPSERSMPPIWAAAANRPTRVGTRTEPPSSLRRAARHAAAPFGLAGALVRTVGAGARNDISPMSFAAPRTVLNDTISGSRRFAADDWAIERLRGVSAATGSTINDVVLAMCSGAVRAYLLERAALPERSMVAMVPIGLKGRSDDPQQGGNALATLMVPLATHESDPSVRLTRIRESMKRGKDAMSHLTPGQIFAVSAAGQVPVFLTPLLRLQGVMRPPCNMIISNVPGPASPLYFNGARLSGAYPLSLPMHGIGLNITCVSYDGNISFGLTGCRRTVPHLQRLLLHLDSEIGALESASGLRS